MTHTVLTSIAPRHPIEGQQERAALSWISKGHPYVTVNAPAEEITVPSGAVRRDARDTRALYGRPYALLDDVLAACGSEVAVITNSDIELTGDIEPFIQQAQDMVMIANRTDYTHDPNVGRPYVHGFDLFIVHRRFFPVIPPSLFVLGLTWWDYFLPYSLIHGGAKVKAIPHGMIAHREHHQQYDSASWVRMGDHFRFVTGTKTPMNPQLLNNHIHRIITTNAR